MSPAVYACDWVTLISCLCNRLNQISFIIILIIISYTIHLVPPKKWSYKAGNGLYSIELLSTCSSGKEVRDFFSFFFFLSFSFVIIVSITICVCFVSLSLFFIFYLFVCWLYSSPAERDGMLPNKWIRLVRAAWTLAGYACDTTHNDMSR
jgi:hypothetical protein